MEPSQLSRELREGGLAVPEVTTAVKSLLGQKDEESIEDSAARRNDQAA